MPVSLISVSDVRCSVFFSYRRNKISDEDNFLPKNCPSKNLIMFLCQSWGAIIIKLLSELDSHYCCFKLARLSFVILIYSHSYCLKIKRFRKTILKTYNTKSIFQIKFFSSSFRVSSLFRDPKSRFQKNSEAWSWRYLH